jgi:hypothetical protein
MYRNNFFACVLAVACFTILTPSLGAAQTSHRQVLNGGLAG